MNATQTVNVIEGYVISAADLAQYGPASTEHNARCDSCGTAARILEDAYAEEVSRSEALAYAENDTRNERLASPNEIKEVTAARALGATTEQLARIRAILEERNTALNRASALQERVNALQGEEIMGDDPRLLQFWIKAAREATDAGYCPEYDRIADAAGGPTRNELREQGYLSQNYIAIVKVTRYLEVEVEAENEGDAMEQARYEVENHGPENYDIADGYSDEVRDYSARPVN